MMYRFLISISIILLLPAAANGQSLGGRITDRNGTPVPYSTVYIGELKQGTTANAKGEYMLNLKPGEYNIIYQSLGFSPELRKVTMGETNVTLNVSLQVQYYEIPEVRVISTGEDPAYGIMRKVIGLAPYYLNQVKHYQAEVYVKGSAVIRQIPKIMKRQLEVNDEDIREGEVYLIESLNEIEFNAPDKYDQRIISQQSTLPESAGTDISPMDIVTASFYQPLLADIAVSPLSPNAMSFYRYRYEGSTYQGNWVINKIAVIPKRKSQQVFEGTLYIVEDLWCLHSVDLKNENLAGSISIKQIYTPVQDDIWMPVSHSFDVNISIVGVKADGTYGSAVTYNTVEPNTDLPVPEARTDIRTREQPVDESLTVKSKEQEKIEEILGKNELSNRDMVKLSRLMEKEAQKSDTASRSLEIKNTTSFTIDEEAGLRDSSYWNSVRPIPLSDEEMKSIRVIDSLNSRKLMDANGTGTDSTDTGQQEPSSFVGVLRAVASGKSFSNKDNTLTFRYGGIVNLDKLGFNTVDGFSYGTDFQLTGRFENGNRISVAPEISWAFGREKLMWRVNSSLVYNRMKQARLTFITGRYSQDYTNSAPIGAGLNMFTSLLFRDNYMKLYENRYLGVIHRHEVTNGLYLDLRYYRDDRKVLDNNSDFSIFARDREYSPNIPANSYLPDSTLPGNRYALRDHLHNAGRITLIYTPRQRYRIFNGVKSAAGSSYPTFSLSWEHGYNSLSGTRGGAYDLLRFEVSKSRNVGAFSEYSWRLRAGGFLDNQGVEFQDFVHFNSQPVPVLFKNYQDVFMLPAYYSLATPEYWVEAHARLTTPYFLVKLLPFLSNTLIRENLSIAYLYTPATGNYYELGYALSELFFLAKAGIYVGFEDLSFKGVGFRFTFNFD